MPSIPNLLHAWKIERGRRRPTITREAINALGLPREGQKYDTAR
jgi:hypothetical protein